MYKYMYDKVGVLDRLDLIRILLLSLSLTLMYFRISPAFFVSSSRSHSSHISRFLFYHKTVPEAKLFIWIWM